MNSTKPGHLPSIVSGTDAATFTNPLTQPGDDSGRAAAGGYLPRRIEGRFCPFCGGGIPQEFIFCTHCGRNV